MRPPARRSILTGRRRRRRSDLIARSGGRGLDSKGTRSLGTPIDPDDPTAVGGDAPGSDDVVQWRPGRHRRRPTDDPPHRQGRRLGGGPRGASKKAGGEGTGSLRRITPAVDRAAVSPQRGRVADPGIAKALAPFGGPAFEIPFSQGAIIPTSVSALPDLHGLRIWRPDAIFRSDRMSRNRGPRRLGRPGRRGWTGCSFYFLSSLAMYFFGSFATASSHPLQQR